MDPQVTTKKKPLARARREAQVPADGGQEKTRSDHLQQQELADPLTTTETAVAPAIQMQEVDGSAPQGPPIQMWSLRNLFKKKKPKISQPKNFRRTTQPYQLIGAIETADDATREKLKRNRGFLGQLESTLNQKQYDYAMGLLNRWENAKALIAQAEDADEEGKAALRKNTKYLQKIESILTEAEYKKVHDILFMGFRSAPALPEDQVSLPSQEPDEDMLGVLAMDFAIEEDDPDLVSEHKLEITIGANKTLGEINTDTDTIGPVNLSSPDEIKVWSQRERKHGNKDGYVFKMGDKTYWVPKENTSQSESGWIRTNDPLWPVDDTGKKKKPTPQDVKQGALGDCYLEAAIGSLAAKKPNFIYGMMNDRGDSVVVRLYDVDVTDQAHPQFQPKYVAVEKSVAKKGSGEALYNSGALWVSMIEKAYAAGGFGGRGERTTELQGKTISMANIAGGREEYALMVLTGSGTGEVTWVSSGEAQDNFNLNALPWSDAEIQEYYNVAKVSNAYAGLATFNGVYGGSKAKTDGWFGWLTQAKLDKIYELETNKRKGAYKSEVRLEDFKKLFTDEGLAGGFSGPILTYLEKFYPGKKGTGKYTEKQVEIFNEIERRTTAGLPMMAGTHKTVGRSPTGVGHSGGESMAKGLVGGHAYSVLRTKVEGGLRWIEVRNPWGDYTRKYDFTKARGSGDRTSEERSGKGEFWIELSDFTKRFVTFSGHK